jgi:hypothetical protein
MALLGRFLVFIARLTLGMLGVLGRLLLRLTLHLTQVIAGWMLNLMGMAFMATVTGPGEFIDRHAGDWTQRLLANGVSRDHLDNSHRFSRFMIGSMIVAGWVLIVAGTVIVVATIVWIVP